MKLWRIEKPDFDTERDEVANNGSLTFPFGLPGVKCCGTWAGCDLSENECPSELRAIKELNDGWPVTPERLEQLLSTLRQFPRFKNLGITELKPGMRFLPPQFSPPDFPDNDFLWPALEAPVISLRIAALLCRYCPNDFVALPIEGHPDWILLFIKNRTLPPLERRSNNVCQRCGRPNRISAPTELIVYDDMVPNGDLFVLDTTLHILVSDRLKQQLEEIGDRNVKFEPISTRTKPEQSGEREPPITRIVKP
jgi:hypothetical protein